mgnify:CR=1 FL=1
MNAPATGSAVLYEARGAVALLTLNRPERLNSFTTRMPEELRAAQPMCRQKIMEKHLANGVIVMDTNSVYIDPRVKIGAGTTLLPGTILRGETVIGEHCTIGPNAMVNKNVEDGEEQW